MTWVTAIVPWPWFPVARASQTGLNAGRRRNARLRWFLRLVPRWLNPPPGGTLACDLLIRRCMPTLSNSVWISADALIEAMKQSGDPDYNLVREHLETA